MAAAPAGGASSSSLYCFICGRPQKVICGSCRMFVYCSNNCQIIHWEAGHYVGCMQTYPLVTTVQSTKISNKILLPDADFVRILYSEMLDCPPCGLKKSGNSCFANVVFQCLAYTQPLFAYLSLKGHQNNCEVGRGCFFCEFQTLMTMITNRNRPFYPIGILKLLDRRGFSFAASHDAHKFMRFAIDAMQSVCRHEFGGQNIVQHIFIGRLQLQVKCTRCDTVSNKFDDMVDLRVAIHPAAGSLHECLYGFTAEEYLDSRYPCASCKDLVMSRKKISVDCAPHILTIVLRRNEGMLNQRVTFPEKLDLRRHMSDSKREYGNYEYKLYAVIIHIELATNSGHYICYVKDCIGNWYKVDDDTVRRVDLPEVLEQNAYILLYSRTYGVSRGIICPRK